MRLHNWYFLILLLPLGYFIWQFYFQKGFKYFSTIKYPDIKKLQPSIKNSIKLQVRRHLMVLKFIALMFLIIAAARPQSGQRTQDVESEGIDIMLILDVSYSMKAEDFKPSNRLHVAKKVLAEFVKGRKTDRIGLVVFARESFTQCPQTDRKY